MIENNKKTIKVSDAFQSWLKDNNYIDRTIGFQIAENWQKIAGKTIYDHTENISVRLPKVFLKINNSSLRELLFLEKELLIDKINTFTNQDVVEDIIFT
jgi:hypothetical protein